ncbi:phage antirepressor KilAC domain-containing protein [Spirosoma sp. BT702]|uniref:Phage antirepressor KilAC domain-containing protein n=1 Tax=Spirosoma profusum TaxID=2771354 RepID=A0A926XVY9_9BACT|nr:phage antirepressor KilAC domain-containing protein [Spirosoma profusum]MBD2700771.1 phage antirepressor KilAC domain-containing protein [Spirosoma profusum]
MNQLQVFNYQGFDVEFELIDGHVYANATAMCKPFGKQANDWMRLTTTIRYVNALNGANRENPVSLIISRKGGEGGGGSTWIHEKLILKLAQWLDVDFEIWCDEQIAKLIRQPQQIVTSQYYLPQNHIEALQAYLDQLRVTQEQQLQIEAAQPKVEQYDRTMNAEGTYTVAEAAKMIGTGQNRLFDFLREQNIFFYQRGHNQPYQQYVDLGWFKVRQKTFNRGGKEESYPQLFVTPKGVEAIRKKWDAAHKSAPTTSETAFLAIPNATA